MKRGWKCQSEHRRGTCWAKSGAPQVGTGLRCLNKYSVHHKDKRLGSASGPPKGTSVKEEKARRETLMKVKETG